MRPLNWPAPQQLDLPERCLFLRPQGLEGAELPVLYLLHGQHDHLHSWCDHGGLRESLGAVAMPALQLVMPFCAPDQRENPKEQQEPPLEEFPGRFATIRARVEERPCDRQRRGILGISMGRKQALVASLNDLPSFSDSAF